MNPLIIRGIRESLRSRHLIAYGLFSLILCSTIYLSAFLDGSETRGFYDHVAKKWEKAEPSDVNGARNAFTYLLALQGFYLMFLGTGRVASITAEERESGLLDYQRMTPMNPLSKIIGYVFGVPAREYYMLLLTLPFLLHCIWVGELPLSNILHLYAVFFSSVFLYHLTAHSIGLVVPKPRAASWVSRIVVLGLYVILPGLGQAGISFLSFLTILPTYFGQILPILKFEGERKLGRFEAKAADFWQDVPFFEFEISPSAFTFLMQALLILVFLTTAYRKWRNQALPALSKISGLFLFIVFQFLLLGSLWEFFSAGKASGLLGQSLSGNAFSQGPLGHSQKIISLILVQTIYFGLSILAILTLINVCSPNRHLYEKGFQRAQKLALPKVPLAADERSSAWFACALSALTGVTSLILSSVAQYSNFWPSLFFELENFLFPFFVILSLSLYLQAGRELWFNLGFWGLVGMLWFTPLLASLVLAVGWEEEFLGLILKLLGLNPICLISLHFLTESAPWIENQKHLSALNEARWFGLGLGFTLVLVFQFRLFLKRK